MHIEEHNHCFMQHFGVKTLSETPFSPPLIKAGYGARRDAERPGPPRGLRRVRRGRGRARAALGSVGAEPVDRGSKERKITLVGLSPKTL